MGKQEFSATLIKVPDMDATYVKIPFDVKKEFGKKSHVKVKAWINGWLYRGSIADMGEGNMLIVTKEIRRMIGKIPGDEVHIVVEEDKDERGIDIPPDLKETFRKNPEAVSYFITLSHSNRKEYVKWITGAKRPETREKRLGKMIELLLMKKKNPSDKS
jgi:hypothetical protein